MDNKNTHRMQKCTKTNKSQTVSQTSTSHSLQEFAPNLKVLPPTIIFYSIVMLFKKLTSERSLNTQ